TTWGINSSGPGQVESGLSMKAKTHFAFRIDIWDDTGNSIVEHVAGVDDFEVAEATYRAAVARWPATRITLWQAFGWRRHRVVSPSALLPCRACPDPTRLSKNCISLPSLIRRIIEPRGGVRWPSRLVATAAEDRLSIAAEGKL